jgi:hypothetical protein
VLLQLLHLLRLQLLPRTTAQSAPGSVVELQTLIQPPTHSMILTRQPVVKLQETRSVTALLLTPRMQASPILLLRLLSTRLPQVLTLMLALSPSLLLLLKLTQSRSLLQCRVFPCRTMNFLRLLASITPMVSQRARLGQKMSLRRPLWVLR